MMTSPTLEPYREEIRERLRRGQSKAEIKRGLEHAHGLTLGRSQFYAFVDHVSADPSPDMEEESVMPPRETVPPESVLADDTVRAFFVELPRAVQEMTERLAALEQHAGNHQQATLRALREFHETLTKMETSVQARPEPPAQAVPLVTATTPPPPAPILAVTLRRIWKRAFLVSGVVYLLLDVLFVWGYWRPLWNALVK